MLPLLLIAGIQFASYTIPVAQRDGAIAQFGVAGWQEPAIPLTFPPFDTNLGTLTDVELVFNYRPTWEYRAENMTPLQGTTPIQWGRALQVNVVYRPSFVGPVEFDLRNRFGVNAPSSINALNGFYQGPANPFDGVLDFNGPSGFSTTYDNSGGYNWLVDLHSGPDALELWYWSLPSPRTVYLCPRRLQAAEFTTGFPGHWIAEDDIRCHFSGSVTVMYHYN